MIDIHCHILPEFDDGAKTLEESLAMAEMSASAGVSVVVATPHIGADGNEQVSHSIRESVDALQSAIDDRGIALKVLPGAEVFPSSAVPEWLDDCHPISLGESGNYLLLDCPLMNLPIGLDQLVFRLQARGVTPILAHPERVLPIQRELQLLETLVRNGMLIQLDAMSVLGKNGSAAATTANRLLRHRWVHFLASDAHSSNHSRPQLGQAAQALTGIIGEDRVRQLTWENPQRLLKGKPVPTEPAEYRPRGFLEFLRR